MSKNQYKPYYKVHPAEIISEEVVYLLKEFKKDITLSNYELDQLLNREIKINEEIAEKLEQSFGPSKQFWLNLQKNYDKK
jgi:addiction module HigA family antidote